MMIEIDFSSDEAIYIQLTNQIIMGIATSRLQEGDTLPSVRQLADTVGINMHTVNKAYSLLRQEGFVTIDRRRGAVISIDVNKRKALEELKQNLMVALAKGCCHCISNSLKYNAYLHFLYRHVDIITLLSCTLSGSDCIYQKRSQQFIHALLTSYIIHFIYFAASQTSFPSLNTISFIS